LLTFLVSNLIVHADEGMWTLYDLPQAVYETMRHEGYQLPYDQLYRSDNAVMKAVVNFSGYCSGVVVSRDGLVFTNHHCGFEAIRSHSTVEHDYMLNGFYAKTFEEELPNENMFVSFMVEQYDVTDSILTPAFEKLTTKEKEIFLDSIENAWSHQVKAKDSTLRLELKPFYEGNRYFATTYRDFTDLRLVFAIPKSMGKFGGETDNWMWPRQTCDFSVFRIYADPKTNGPAAYSKDNVPYHPEHWARVSMDGYQEGSFSMTLGYPGSTSRYLSSYGIAERYVQNDIRQQIRGVKQQVMKRHMDASEAVRIKYDSKYATSSNYWKNSIGMNKCIDSIGLIAQKQQFEQQLQQWVEQTGNFRDQLDFKKMKRYYAKRLDIMKVLMNYSETFRRTDELSTRALKVHNGMNPVGKGKKQYVTFADNSETFDVATDKEILATLLQNYRKNVTNPTYIPEFFKTIDKKFRGDYQKYADYLYDHSLLMKTGKRIYVNKRKFKKDIGAQFGLDLTIMMADLRTELEKINDSIDIQERYLCAAKLRYEEQLPHYSDANFTMRLSYGQVREYCLDGKSSGYYTAAPSMHSKMMKGDEIEDYRVEPEMKTLFGGNSFAPYTDPKTGDMQLCFLTTNDITGGNSGSPMFDGHNRLIGLAFDGNWDSLSSDILFDSKLARCIGVDIRYVLFMMDRWGHADRLLSEIRESTAATAPRQEQDLADNWQFYKVNKGDAEPAAGQEPWQTISIPHDWAISGPFDKKWDLQKVAIEQNGEKEATEKSGRSGSLPWIGKGSYKRTFNIPAGFNGHAELLFDGAMAEPTVYINGKKAGYWAYGYNAFRIDATPFIHAGENQLRVDLQNVEESSRWYPGAGIYRPVTLILTDKERLDPWQTYIRTTAIADHRATLAITTDVPTAPSANAQLSMEIELHDHAGLLVARKQIATDANGHADMTFDVENAKLWSPESPYLYRATLKLLKNGYVIDRFIRNVGLRTVEVSANGGFQLNGQTRKIKGVCLHHDLGPLGAAINKAALIRQLKTMKEMGCDAIRTAHNMPSQMQMDLCDSLGLMVMAESFDMWIYPKCKNGYARFFKEWSDKDVTNMVLANRNHPSIVMWSIGNEIPEQWSKEGREIAIHLQDLCHKLDSTRPVTQGMDRIEVALKSGFAQAMDVPGMNYRVHKYLNSIRQLPQKFLLGSETASTVSSRGVYKFPVKIDDNSKFSSWAKNYDPKAIKTADGQCSSYDVEYCSWSNLPDDDWCMQDDYPWVIGEFVWTGYDYLGEPTPYDEYWPSRSSYFGICDLAGLPKDRYWLYRSKWNRDEHTIHMLPHWTWNGPKTKKNAKRGSKMLKTAENRIGQVTPVYCYTNYPEGELFLNGKSQGRVKKAKASNEEVAINPDRRLDRYRLRWNDVKYEPGELRVVVYDENGRQAGEETIRTASEPDRLQLDVWTQHDEIVLNSQLKDDLAFVTVSLVDKDGTLIPYADDRMRFEVEGAGRFRAVCNGDATSLESFAQPTMKLFAGQLVVIIQGARQPGNLRLRVIDDDRKLEQTVTIKVQ